MLNRKRQRGLNLVEAVVALAILGLLTAVAVPSFAEWMASTRMRTVAELTQNGLQKARGEALRRNRQVTFWLVSSVDSSCALSSVSPSWVISIDDPTGKCATAPSATTAPRIVEAHGAGQLPGGISIEALDASGAAAASSVTFNGFGQVAAGSLARVRIKHVDTSQRELRIEISPSGGVRMCEPAVERNKGDPRECTQ